MKNLALSLSFLLLFALPIILVLSIIQFINLAALQRDLTMGYTHFESISAEVQNLQYWKDFYYYLSWLIFLFIIPINAVWFIRLVHKKNRRSQE